MARPDLGREKYIGDDMGRAREHQLKIYVFDEERDEIKLTAKAAGLSTAEYIRRCCLSGEKILVQDRAAILRLIEEVNRIGNNINQIARTANSTGTILKEDISKLISWQRELCRAAYLIARPKSEQIE